MSRPFSLVAALSVLLIVAACGGGNTSTPAVQQSATDTPPTSVSASPPAAPTSADTLPPLTRDGGVLVEVIGDGGTRLRARMAHLDLARYETFLVEPVR